MTFYEARGESISGLLKNQWPLPIQPVKALKIVTRNFLDSVSTSTRNLIEIKMKNVSEKDIILRDFDVELLNSSEFQLKKLEPENREMQLTNKETYSMIVELIKKHSIFNSSKKINFGLFKFNFDFLDRTNDGGTLSIKLEKPNEEGNRLKLLLFNKSELNLVYHEVTELKLLLTNISSDNGLIKIDKNIKDNSAIGLHKIFIDSTPKQNSLYELKAGQYISLRLVIFPRSRGTFKFNFIKVYWASKTLKVVDYDAPNIIIH